MMKRLYFLLLILSALMLTACGARSASTPVTLPGGGDAGAEPTSAPVEGESTSSAPVQLETVMAGELATQTAIAADPGGGQAGEPTQEPTATPVNEAANPTQVPTEEPTATQAPQPTATQAPQQQATPDCTSPYTVKPGDWVWDIGRRCNIHPDSIIAANGLRWPYLIYPGDILILPANAPPFPPE